MRSTYRPRHSSEAPPRGSTRLRPRPPDSRSLPKPISRSCHVPINIISNRDSPTEFGDFAYGESRRDFEGADDESGLDSADSDASQREVLVEAPYTAKVAAVMTWRRNSDFRDELQVLFA